MFCSKKESAFFLSHIDKTHRVLEYGSGSSTIEISALCKNITSVEHSFMWYKKLKRQHIPNLNLIFEAPDKECLPPDDGTLEQFKTYIHAPLKYAPFDIILIDGRARVECAKLCKKLGHKDTLVFIHDFERPEYHEALEYLHIIETVERMSKFKIK